MFYGQAFHGETFRVILESGRASTQGLEGGHNKACGTRFSKR